jgi:hypothetical protein
MTGTLRAGVVIAVLLAVATTLIAPTVDLPETVLREHHVVSHASGEHAQGKLQTSSNAGPSYLLVDAVGGYLPLVLRSTDHVDAKPFRVLRC